MSSARVESGVRGLSDVSLGELQALRRGLEDARLALPLHDLALVSLGIPQRRCRAIESGLAGLDAAAARAVLDLVIAERLHRPPPRLELVWTGPEAKGTSARDTSIVVRQLFDSATESVIIGGFRFDQGALLFRSLHARMQRGVMVSIFVDIEGHAPTPSRASAYADRYVRGFLAENWPFGAPYPAVYYDPQSAVAGPPWVSLHAKCVVVDDATSFITSANFTNRGQTRNLEVGVLIEDRAFAEKLAGQWRALVARGLVVRAAAAEGEQT